MKLTARASVEIPKPADQVFDFATSCEGFPRFIWAYGPIPGITRAEMVGGQPPKAGAERHIYMTDGNVVEEELLAYDRPSRHRYRWLKPPAFPFSLIVRTAEGDWCFTATGGGTRIDWNYSFELTSVFALPLAAPLMIIFRRWMLRTLLRARTVLAPECGQPTPKGLYARFHAGLLGPAMAALSDRAGLRAQRRRLLSTARGTTLEIHGFGTGRNFGLYPNAVTELVLVQPLNHVDDKLERRVAAFGNNARVINATGPSLPFAPHSFDTVVTTLALCFADDLGAVIDDIARVLRPGGQLLFLEHVRSPTPVLARWQERLSPAWHAIAVGCHCNYDTLASIEASPLRIEWYERGVLPVFPLLVRPLIVGAAIAAS